MAETRGAPSTPPASLGEALGWVGQEIDEIDGQTVGSVRGLFAEAGVPAWLIAAIGRRRARLVAIPVSDCAAAGGRVWVAHGKETIYSSPVIDPTRPLLREHELAICAHYGIGERVGRGAEVAGRPEGSVTSQPTS
jgi:hypothetical protein